MGDAADFVIGQSVELGDGRIAVVRFVGGTQFAPGDWLGVELEDNSGKNDGAVQGQRYFDCAAGHGMFVRPSVAVVISQPAAKPAKRAPAANGVATKGRPSSTSNAALATKRQSVLDPIAKRRSINAGSPTPAPRPSSTARALRSPSKSPTKQLNSRPSSTSAARSMPPPTSNKPSLMAGSSKRTSITGRPSLTPSTKTVSAGTRPPVASKMSATTRPSIGGTRPSAVNPAVVQRQNSARSAANGIARSEESGQVSPSTSQDARDRSPGSEHETEHETNTTSQDKARATRPSETVKPTRTTAPPSRPTAAATAALNREVEDLKTKVKVLENRRTEDRDKLKNLEKVQTERDKFENIIQKLQAKYQPQQQEIAELRKQIRDAEGKIEAAETERAEIDTAVEMATLDREMAEESAEGYKQELETIRGKYEELELEVEILREENTEFSKEMSPEERTSQGWLQMERNNERLKEALLRLRDITQDQESELRNQIEELQTETADLATLREKYEQTKSKLESSEEASEELKQQLEGALGAEDMIEELSEKNMSLTERIDELKSVIEDLESLKELNDELELNHIEHEKQLQEEIEEREALHVELARKSNTQDETITDLEYTISRFRELVSNLQSSLEDMRASQQITENEATELSSRSKAMMDLNLRLQASASKSQNKAIEMELGRLEAQEAIDHLNIVQCFLPESYAIDKDSVNAYLRIKRIAFKSDLLHGFVKERANGIAVPGREKDTFAACIVMDELVWVSAMCQRFVNFIKGCSLESFKKIEGALYDLEPVERALSGWIESLRRGDLKEPQCASELKRSIAVMSHLAEVHIPDTLQQHAEDIHLRALVMQSRLENSAVAVNQIKSVAQAKIILPTDADEEDEAAVERFVEKAESLVAQLRSSKVISGKAVHQLEELLARSLTLDPSTQALVEEAEKTVSDFVSACQSSATGVLDKVGEEDSESSLTYDDIVQAISPQDSSPFSRLLSMSQNVMTQVQNFHTLTGTLAQSVEFSSPSSQAPWRILSQKLKAEADASALHEKEVLRLRDQLKEKNTTVAIKDKAIEELNVNVEVLSKRVNDSGGRKERLKELELAIENSRSREQELTAKISSIELEKMSLEEERERWKQAVPGTSGSGSEAAAGAGTGAATATGGVAISAHVQAELESLKMEMDRVSASVRHLHQASQRNRVPTSESWLAEPLVRRKKHDEQSSLRQESHEVFKSLLNIVDSPNTAVVGLEVGERNDRLSWRPASSRLEWKVGKQQEQWEAWREWHQSACSSHKQLQKRLAMRANRSAAGGGNGQFLARIGVNLPWVKSKVHEEVRIMDAEEWTEVEKELGVV